MMLLLHRLIGFCWMIPTISGENSQNQTALSSRGVRGRRLQTWRDTVVAECLPGYIDVTDGNAYKWSCAHYCNGGRNLSMAGTLLTFAYECRCDLKTLVPSSDYSARVCKEIHMRYTPLAGLLLLCHHVGTVQVTIERSSRQLLVDGQRFFARGVAYTPIPVGSDYGDYLGASQAAIWTQDLELMRLGVNELARTSTTSWDREVPGRVSGLGEPAQTSS
eukprot:g17317.t1